MTSSYQRRYNGIFHQVVHKEGESEIKYINIFHHAKALLILVLNGSFEYHLMQNFLGNFHKDRNYSAHIETHQA